MFDYDILDLDIRKSVHVSFDPSILNPGIIKFDIEY